MKPNFEEMSVPELRAYVLEHREDDEAIRALFHHPSLEHKWKTMPPMFAEDGKPIEENIRLAEEEFRKAMEKDRKREQKNTLKSKKDHVAIAKKTFYLNTKRDRIYAPSQICFNANISARF